MNMKAGRELDALVSETFGIYAIAGGSFEPSTNISDAWEVVEKLVEENEKLKFDLKVDKTFVMDYEKASQYWRKSYVGRFEEHLGYMQSNLFVEEADTAPLAICLASLKAKGIDIDAN
jgi:hypothetical protein